ncbi:hypothetical protein PUN28_011767 [Cardiocondyla obscurior]|uniref:Uncharacterized protein n=1 Tax=Cardiocondyla obscurior TaxID=286306 RepID=A0AAW2FL91_9HYME
MSVSLENGLEYSVAVERRWNGERQDAVPNEEVDPGKRICVSPELTSRIDHLRQRILIMDRFLFVARPRRSVYLDTERLYYVNEVTWEIGTQCQFGSSGVSLKRDRRPPV